MKFRSSSDQPTYLGLTSGHTAVVTPEGVELDKKFHKEAIAQGCLPEGIEDEPQEQAPAFDRKQVITDALNAMLAGSDPDDFTSAGKPSLTKLNARVGFTVARVEADAIWDELSKTAE